MMNDPSEQENKSSRGKPTATLERAERRRRVLALRQAGSRPPEIARALGVTERTVFNDMKALAKDIAALSAAESKAQRSLEVARLDALQKRLIADQFAQAVWDVMGRAADSRRLLGAVLRRWDEIAAAQRARHGLT